MTPPSEQLSDVVLLVLSTLIMLAMYLTENPFQDTHISVEI